MKKLILRINGIVEHPDRDLEIAEHEKIVDALNEAVGKLGFGFSFVADNAVVDEHGRLILKAWGFPLNLCEKLP